MRIAVLGVGGVGGYFGAKLAASGVDVAFMARGATLDVLRSEGLRLVDGDQTLQVDVQASDDPVDIGPVDYVLSCVKATQVISALEPAGGLIGPDTGVITTQNGVDGPRLTASVVGREHTIPGVVKVFAKIESPGVIRHMGGPGSLEVAEWQNTDTERIAALREIFASSSIPTPVPSDIWELLWMKSMIVVPPGGLGAITGLPLGEMLTRPALRRLLGQAMAEIRDVAAARGVQLPDDIVADTLIFEDAQPPASTTSLQRDLAAGRPSELDPQLGAVVRYGRDAGVPTPLHELMYEVLKLGRGKER